MGGWIAETIAARHPERVRAAAFLGSCNPPTSWEKAITTVERDLARLDYDLPPLFYATETMRYLPNKDLQDDALVDTWLMFTGDQEPWPNPGRLGQYEACLAWSTDPEHGDAWPTISVPCLIMAYEHDVDSPPARAPEAAAIIPGARYVEIPDTSHLAPFTHAEHGGRRARRVLPHYVSGTDRCTYTTNGAHGVPRARCSSPASASLRVPAHARRASPSCHSAGSAASAHSRRPDTSTARRRGSRSCRGCARR